MKDILNIAADIAIANSSINKIKQVDFCYFLLFNSKWEIGELLLAVVATLKHDSYEVIAFKG